MVTMSSETDAVGVILAAGRGNRMRSRLPKPLHPLAGKPLVCYPVALLRECGVAKIVVVVSPDNRDAIAGVLGDEVAYAVQPSPDGTAAALACGLAALPAIPPRIVALAGDTPLVRAESVRQLMTEHAANPSRRMTVLSAPDVFAPDLGHVQRSEPTGAGGIGPVTAITEAPDREAAGRDALDRAAGSCGPAEVNTGVYCFDGPWLADRIAHVPPAPSGERYLTALVAMAADAGEDVAATPTALADEAMGVNDRIQLAAAGAALRDRINCHWMARGVTIIDPATTYVDAGVVIGLDTVLLPNTMLTGHTVIGEACEIGPNSVVSDTAVADRCRIVASTLEGAQVNSDVDIGPYSHLRPDAVIETGVHLGNYVEVKNSRVGPDTAAGHFCYLGDADVGAGVNVGAGTITCNYDGVNKHRTAIGDRAFIGSDTMLIAPVTVGEDAATGAGAVVTRNIPEGRRAVGVPARLLPSKERESN